MSESTTASAPDIFITKVTVSNFKKIAQAGIPLNNITYLIGGNNSGKSSVLQAIHTAFSCAQLHSNEGGKGNIPEADLFYSPTENFPELGHGKDYKAHGKGGEVVFTYRTADDASSESTYGITMRKASNKNNVKVKLTGKDSDPIRKAIDDKRTLFSVYVPGLTGIPLREEYKSRGAILRTAAGGEANLVFRNILLQLAESNRPKESNIRTLEAILSKIVGVDAKFEVKFDKEVDRYIYVRLSVGNNRPLPIDLWGTGVLQATQIAAYALLFRPTLLLVDEPDSHLHPDLQKTLISALKEIVDTIGCQIVLTTHSRHMITAAPEGTRVVWMKDGKVENCDARDISEVLLDLGALDSFDCRSKIILYTEDSGSSSLTQCIEATPETSQISCLSYDGIKNAPKVAQLSALVNELNITPRIVIHRDRDCLTDDEIKQWSKPYEDAGMCVFIPSLSDTEAYYCLPEHVSKVLEKSEHEAQELLDSILTENIQQLRAKFDAKRKDAVSQFHATGGGPEAGELWNSWQQDKARPWRNICGKALLKLINSKVMNERKVKLESEPSSKLLNELNSFLDEIST
ncbi:ATP-dependent nuclease [Actinomyces gaoshouyii]|uniref:AAA+ ATPase domain-containing protein n=1 Tax=Actinomyces gaoshouyii TaxID=1960083 RepID=A0A8H9LIW4_9ACTO|nr:ATP-binding protein [Actinomyces gaoshouyii]GGO98487.1 hypothetical protein GCM10011612_13500 [Actinomyces gaoshouyii]